MKPAPGKEWTMRVIEVLDLSCLQGIFGAAAVAGRLRCSERTLVRRLNQEGTSLRALTDSMRLANARRLMGRRDITLGEIACLLGFSELTVFHRAFVRWTGSTPGEYRKKLRAPLPPQKATTTAAWYGARPRSPVGSKCRTGLPPDDGDYKAAP